MQGRSNWTHEKAFTLRPRHLVADQLLIAATWVFTVTGTGDPVCGARLLKCKARFTARGDLVDPARIIPDQLNAPTVDPEMVRVIVGAYLNSPFKSHEPTTVVRAPQGMVGLPERHVLQLSIKWYGL